MLHPLPFFTQLQCSQRRGQSWSELRSEEHWGFLRKKNEVKCTLTNALTYIMAHKNVQVLRPFKNHSWALERALFLSIVAHFLNTAEITCTCLRNGTRAQCPPRDEGKPNPTACLTWQLAPQALIAAPQERCRFMATCVSFFFSFFFC